MIYSPFVKYCDSVDEQAIGENPWSLDKYYSFVNDIYTKDPSYIYNLLIADFTHRARFRKNVIMSIEGPQGEGKSLYGLYWSFTLGDIFKRPYDIHQNLYATPEDLDEDLHKTPYRTTHQQDEQRKKKVGVGSVATDLSLQDYEEQCRWTQKNIIWIAPELRNHNHYFMFSAPFMERIDNKLCSQCPVKIQDKCFSDSFKTNCPSKIVKLNKGVKIPFYERSGYPKSITCLLKTKRRIDGWIVPRGFVKVPIVNPKTVETYDEIKAQNIARLEKQQDDSFKYKQKVIDEFVKKHKTLCITLTGHIEIKMYKIKDAKGNSRVQKVPWDNRKYVVASQKYIEALLYKFIKAQHKYVTKEIDLMVAVIKEELQRIAQKKNTTLFASKKQ